MRAMCPSIRSTLVSRLARVSAYVRPSGATSRSWNAKNGTPSFSMNSNAASTFACEAVPGSTPGVSHGRSKVPTPKTSEPGQLNECQRQTAIRSWSSIRFPSTTRSGW